LEQQKLQAVLNQYFSKLRQDLKSNDDQIIVYVFVPEPVSFYGSHQQQILKAWLYISSPFEYKYDFKRHR